MGLTGDQLIRALLQGGTVRCHQDAVLTRTEVPEHHSAKLSHPYLKFRRVEITAGALCLGCIRTPSLVR